MQNLLGNIIDTSLALLASADEKPLVRSRHRFIKISEGLDYDQERAFAISLIRNNDKLQQCQQESIADAFIQAGACGLTLNPTMQHTYLIPYFIKAVQAYRCNLSPGYRGLVHIAIDSGAVIAASAEIVHSTDTFQFQGPAVLPLHTFDGLKLRTYDNAVGVYTIAQLAGGQVICGWMDREAILRCRKLSERPNSLMWNERSLWTEGWKKTALRRGYKTWPKVMADVRATRTIEHLNAHEGIDQPRLVSSQGPGDQVEYFTEDQVNQCHAYLIDRGWSDESANRQLARLANAFGGAKLEYISRAMFDKVFERLERGVADSGGPSG